MQIPTEEELVARIDAFLERHEMAPSRFGREATGSPEFLKTVREGRSPTLQTVQRVLKFMAERDAEQLAAEGDLSRAADAARRCA